MSDMIALGIQRFSRYTPSLLRMIALLALSTAQVRGQDAPPVPIVAHDTFIVISKALGAPTRPHGSNAHRGRQRHCTSGWRIGAIQIICERRTIPGNSAAISHNG